MKEPKILLLDLETAPNLGFAWGKWEQNIIENVEDWYILSFAYKWLGEKEIHAEHVQSNEVNNDHNLCLKLWKLFNEADIIVAHNGDAFDIKKSNARFLVHGFKTPSPYKTIDTLKIAKKYFKFDSNKLDELARQLNIGRKIQHSGFTLWRECMLGDKKAFKKMIQYNKNDVVLLEKVYLKLRPWMSSFPIVSPYYGQCVHCGDIHVQKRGFSYTKLYQIQRLQCQSCGAWSQGDKVLAKS